MSSRRLRPTCGSTCAPARQRRRYGHMVPAFVDVHSHVIPSGDDGVASVAEGLALCREAATRGTEVLYGTPHVWPGDGLSAAREEARTRGTLAHGARGPGVRARAPARLRADSVPGAPRRGSSPLRPRRARRAVGTRRIPVHGVDRPDARARRARGGLRSRAPCWRTRSVPTRFRRSRTSSRRTRSAGPSTSTARA